MEPYITTFTGALVNPLRMRPEDIRITDIAHALACTNRFAGHTETPISVAQHSVYVSRLCSIDYRRQGLLHDASEAYLGDVTKWLKLTPAFTAYREAEDRLQVLIYQIFGCPIDMAPEVEVADRLMVRYEGEQGFGHFWRPPTGDYDFTSDKERQRIGAWTPWGWKEAEEQFLYEYERCS